MARARATPKTSDAVEPSAGEGAHLCSVGFCPVAMLLTATQQVRPEVMEHLLAASREVLLALKSVVDARVEGLERSSPLERIQVEIE
jgi:hypothetical protein